MHGIRNVLELSRAQVFELGRAAPLHLVTHGRRDTHATGLGDGLEPGGDVHAVAEEPVALDRDLAQVDPDAEVHATRGRQGLVAGFHDAVDLERAVDRIRRGAELGEEVVAREIDESATRVADQKPHLVTITTDRADGRFLVVRHQAAVTEYIARDDGAEPAFECAGSHPPQIIPSPASNVERRP